MTARAPAKGRRLASVVEPLGSPPTTTCICRAIGSGADEIADRPADAAVADRLAAQATRERIEKRSASAGYSAEVARAIAVC
jgi:hypothetical protein